MREFAFLNHYKHSALKKIIDEYDTDDCDLLASITTDEEFLYTLPAVLWMYLVKSKAITHTGKVLKTIKNDKPILKFIEKKYAFDIVLERLKEMKIVN